MLIISVILATAFFTLLEHKIIGYTQIRKGPTKVGFYGIFQPFSDALKLLSKELFIPSIGNSLIFRLSPVLSLLLVLSVWMAIPSKFGRANLILGALFFLCCTRLRVYAVLRAGWASNSKYSILGSLRRVAQTISYEVVLAILIICLVLFLGSFSFQFFTCFKTIFLFMFFMPLKILWLVVCLAETNRTPFDFSEGESELVSGFNTEFSSSRFVLIFLAEYIRILFICGVTAFLFIGFRERLFIFLIFTLRFGSFFVWVRRTLPRLRYDKLIILVWKIYLPLTLLSLIILTTLKLLIW